MQAGPRSVKLAEACFESEAFSSDDCLEIEQLPFSEALGHAYSIWCEGGRAPEELDPLLRQAGIIDGP